MLPAEVCRRQSSPIKVLAQCGPGFQTPSAQSRALGAEDAVTRQSSVAHSPPSAQKIQPLETIQRQSSLATGLATSPSASNRLQVPQDVVRQSSLTQASPQQAPRLHSAQATSPRCPGGRSPIPSTAGSSLSVHCVDGPSPTKQGAARSLVGSGASTSSLGSCSDRGSGVVRMSTLGVVSDLAVNTVVNKPCPRRMVSASVATSSALRATSLEKADAQIKTARLEDTAQRQRSLTASLATSQQSTFQPQEHGLPIMTDCPEASVVHVAADIAAAATEAQGEVGKMLATFPSTGKPITVKLINPSKDMSNSVLMVNSFFGAPITSDWEQCHLLQVSEALTGVPRNAQKLYHAGREITPGCTIRAAMGIAEAQLPPRCAVHVLADLEAFPQKLGPFCLKEVPLKSEDFLLPKSVEGGFHWTMKSGVLERHGIRCTDGVQVTAQCSPSHAITLSDKEREAAGIPAAAVEFAWSYPVVNWEQVERDPHVLDDWASCSKDVSRDAAVKDFLVVGGFVFLDAARRFVRISTPWSSQDGGLVFGRPLKWEPFWTKALLGDGRFQQVTIGPMRDAGVRYFCWLRPGERIVGEDLRPLHHQPYLPHGGFAYLFHELAGSSPLECAVDCYFPVVAVREQTTSRGEAFAVVGEEIGTPDELVGHTSAQLHVHSICLQDA